MDSIREEVQRVDEEHLAREGSPKDHPELDRLIRTIWRLRQPDGCPWDMEQTHMSIQRNMIEEAYEAAEAMAQDERGEENGAEHLVEELGDVLEQVLLHAQIAADEGAFGIDDIARYLNDKLVRRHPHVFRDGEADSAQSALDSWNSVKKLEREAAGLGDQPEPGLLDSIPISLPALMQCQKISTRAAKAGFEWPDLESAWSDVLEELDEFRAEEPGSTRANEEFGDILFILVNYGRLSGIDAEASLRGACERFRARWGLMEQAAHEQGMAIDEVSGDKLEDLWEQAKKQLASH